MGNKVYRFTELDVYQAARKAAMRIFELSKSFPIEERYSLTDQIRRCSRSVCANLAEAWRKRQYKAAFIAKLVDCEGEAAETQSWLLFAKDCKYLEALQAETLFNDYEKIAGQLISMKLNADQWIFSR